MGYCSFSWSKFYAVLMKAAFWGRKKIKQNQTNLPPKITSHSKKKV
jgi:hypothetical protein